MYGTTIGVVKGDTRSLDYSSDDDYGLSTALALCVFTLGDLKITLFVGD